LFLGFFERLENYAWSFKQPVDHVRLRAHLKIIADAFGDAARFTA
jgi:hypothetical protein